MNVILKLKQIHQVPASCNHNTMEVWKRFILLIVSEGSLELRLHMVKEMKYSKMKDTDSGFTLLQFKRGMDMQIC